MAYSNIENKRKADIRYYRRHREAILNKRNARKREKREWLNKYKCEKGCQFCGENNVACLDFHHDDPFEKETEISLTANSNWSLDRIKKEVEKCTVLCANCHRKLHYYEESTLQVPVVE